MYLYHKVMEQDSGVYISPKRALDEGLNSRTVTRWYTNGGSLFPEITDRYKPINTPVWIDFKIAIGAELAPPPKPYFRFSNFSDKIAVFNRELSSDLFAYIEDEYMEEEAGKKVKKQPFVQPLLCLVEGKVKSIHVKGLTIAISHATGLT